MPNEVTPTQADLAQLQKNAGLPHLPTPLTYYLRLAVSGAGPRAYDWSDKPHRLLHDACRHIEAHEAPLLARNAELRRMLADAADAIDGGNLDSQICCSGYGCGCQGSTVGQLTAGDIRAALATKDTPSHD